MQVTVNDTPYNVPFTLSDITLGKFIEYYDKYGRDLDKEIEAILKKDYSKFLAERWSVDTDAVEPEQIELHQYYDLDDILDKSAVSWYSFWTNSNLFQKSIERKALDEIKIQYRILHNNLKLEEAAAQVFPTHIEWNNDVWQIQNYEVTPDSKIVFNEIISPKEVVRQIISLGKSKWDCLPYLCCIFLRKVNEPFTDSLLSDPGERMELMKQLPMNHALQVAFFLSVCVNTWKNISQSLVEKVEVEKANLN